MVQKKKKNIRNKIAIKIVMKQIHVNTTGQYHLLVCYERQSTHCTNCLTFVIILIIMIIILAVLQQHYYKLYRYIPNSLSFYDHIGPYTGIRRQKWHAKIADY